MKIDKLSVIWFHNGVSNHFEIGFHERTTDDEPHAISINETQDTFEITKTQIYDEDEIMAIPKTEILVIPKNRLLKWFITPQP